MAPIIVKDEITIAKDRASIWNLLTDISRWSRWSRIIKRAAAYGPIKPGTEFKCISGKWDFDGIIVEASPEERFALDAKSIGLRLRLVWEITEQANDTRITATVTASGWIPLFFKHRTTQALEDNLFNWLYALKTTLERGEKPEPPSKHDILKPRRRFTFPGPLNFLFRQQRDE